MERDLEIKYARLKEIISGERSVAVAYSGGVDSSLLLRVSHDLLGKQVTGIYCDSVLQPAREREEAIQMAQDQEIPLIVLEGIDLRHKAFREHPEDRCYLCKGLIFDRILTAARNAGFETVFDGSNTDDLTDYRPGRRALQERGIRSPLQEARLSKKEIRILSKTLGLSTWDKDALACLATRIPYHTPVTREKLQLIDKIETLLVHAGYRNVRARLTSDIITIEVNKDQVKKLQANFARYSLYRIVEETGIKKIIIDPEGYTQGKMNNKIVS